ncbi:MAG: VWA domain-containing protein [Verrucomicrobiales bacterium]|nr:VWA domain-containing protein [Verrucomicrobiales bacterium]
MKNTSPSLVRLLLSSAALLALAAPVAAKKPAPAPDSASVDAKKEALVQLAILLDTSNSMDGLIEQAKSQLWKIVNEFNDAKQDGKVPVVQVALYEYGNSGLSVAGNYIRQVLPFTRDLDRVSEELFKLTTNGGDEYCGAVLQHALDSLEWKANPKVYKAVFIAGNEPFTQGPIEPNSVCRSAIARGVVVNTIHCGHQADGENGGWRTGAALAEGRFLTINQDRAIVHVPAPQDDAITKLSIELNNTYIRYGKDGMRGCANQTAQDSNATALKEAGAAVQRALTKASANYKNSTWDLVDACKKDGVKLGSIDKETLPKELQALSEEEVQKVINEKATQREQIQAEIKKLNQERETFLAQQRKEKAQDLTLDEAISTAVREQAASKAGIAFQNP